MRGPWKAVRHLLPALAAVSSGLLTGAMLFIGLDVAPWARSLSPWEFDAWIWSYGPDAGQGDGRDGRDGPRDAFWVIDARDW